MPLIDPGAREAARWIMEQRVNDPSGLAVATALLDVEQRVGRVIDRIQRKLREQLATTATEAGSAFYGGQFGVLEVVKHDLGFADAELREGTDGN